MAETQSLAGRTCRFVALWFAFVLGCPQPAGARDAFVLISGGGSPFENNFSQYLQARAIVAFFERNYPAESIWTFFGAGNVEGQKPVFGDVRREVRRDGLVLQSWLAGPLSRNLPARREVILRALREEILPAVADGGTLYLFVGDHGSQSRGEDAESLINLWELERDPASRRGWRSSEDESLGVAELRDTLAGGIGKGRVIFCMTQCHSGGFHFLAVPREMTPNPKWFTKPTEWVAPQPAPVLLRAAGFTATDEDSAAAGCDPDPDPDEWAGYERFLPECLSGLDLFTLESTGRGLRSFAEAHEAATLKDFTIDKPYSTSEQYLERWARLIETRLAQETNLTRAVKRLVAAYTRTVDGAKPRVSDRALRERQAQFRGFTERLAEDSPAVKGLLLSGTREELEEVIHPTRGTGRPRRQSRAEGQEQNEREQPQTREVARTERTEPREQTQEPSPRRGRRGRGAASEQRRLWTEVMRPAWKSAVEAGQVPGVTAAALEFEKYLLNDAPRGLDYPFGRTRSLQSEIFWRSGYSDPQTLDPEKAEAIARWGVERRSKILAWAKEAEDEEVRAAAEKLAQSRSRRRPESEPQQAQPPAPAFTGPDETSRRPVSPRTAAERVLFYRRVLAAWQFLLAAEERPALARLRELIELERTPLPPPRS